MIKNLIYASLLFGFCLTSGLAQETEAYTPSFSLIGLEDHEKSTQITSEVDRKPEEDVLGTGGGDGIGPPCINFFQSPNESFGPAPEGWPIILTVETINSVNALIDGQPMERVFFTGTTNDLWRTTVTPTTDTSYTVTLFDDEGDTNTCEKTIDVEFLPPLVLDTSSEPSLDQFEVPVGSEVRLILRTGYALSASINGQAMSGGTFGRYEGFFQMVYTVTGDETVTANIAGPNGDTTASWNITTGTSPACVEIRQIPDTRFEAVAPGTEVEITVVAVNGETVTLDGEPLTEQPSNLAQTFWTGNFIFDSDAAPEVVITNTQDEEVRCETSIDTLALPMIESIDQSPDSTTTPVEGGTMVTFSVTGDDIYSATFDGEPMNLASGLAEETSTWSFDLVASGDRVIQGEVANNNGDIEQFSWTLDTTCDELALDVPAAVVSCSSSVMVTAEAPANLADAQWVQTSGETVSFDPNTNILSFEGVPGQFYGFEYQLTTENCGIQSSATLIFVLEADIDDSGTVDATDLFIRGETWNSENNFANIDMVLSGFIDVFDLVAYVNCLD
jgi:hypothetical protein